MCVFQGPVSRVPAQGETLALTACPPANAPEKPPWVREEEDVRAHEARPGFNWEAQGAPQPRANLEMRSLCLQNTSLDAWTHRHTRGCPRMEGRGRTHTNTQCL